MAYLYIEHKITGFSKVDLGISVETGNFLPKNGYGWKWGIFYKKKSGYGWIWIRPNGVEWSGVSEFYPVKGSSADWHLSPVLGCFRFDVHTRFPPCCHHLQHQGRLSAPPRTDISLRNGFVVHKPDRLFPTQDSCPFWMDAFPRKICTLAVWSGRIRWLLLYCGVLLHGDVFARFAHKRLYRFQDFLFAFE